MKTKLNLFKNLMMFITMYYFKDLSLTNRSNLIRKILYKVDTLYRTRGYLAAATYIKLCRLSITKTLSGEKLPRPFGISLSNDQLPKILPYTIRKRILEGDKLLIQ